MLIVSFDIASKSLAVSIIDFDDNYRDKLCTITTNFRNSIKSMEAMDAAKFALSTLDQIEKVYDCMVKLLLIDVVDLIPGKKVKDTTSILRSSRLAGYLEKVDVLIDQCVKSGYRGSQEIKLLLEYQMSTNFKSNFIFAQIMGHYSKKSYEFKNSTGTIKKNSTGAIKKNSPEFDVIVIGPSLKNKLELDKSKTHSYFIEKYAKKYDANKAHAKSNLLYWLKQCGKEDMIKGIKKKNIDDIADSVTQTLSWIINSYKK